MFNERSYETRPPPWEALHLLFDSFQGRSHDIVTMEDEEVEQQANQLSDELLDSIDGAGKSSTSTLEQRASQVM